MDGGDRSGYKQIAKAVDSVLITTTMGACSATAPAQWVSLEVISSAAMIHAMTAAGLRNASLLTSATTFSQNAVIECSKITMVELDTKLAAGKVILHERVLI